MTICPESAVNFCHWSREECERVVRILIKLDILSAPNALVEVEIILCIRNDDSN